MHFFRLLDLFVKSKTAAGHWPIYFVYYIWLLVVRDLVALPTAPLPPLISPSTSIASRNTTLTSHWTGPASFNTANSEKS